MEKWFFKSTNPFEKWNGGYLGIGSSSGNFVWHARFLYKGASRELKGNVMIVK